MTLPALRITPSPAYPVESGIGEAARPEAPHASQAALATQSPRPVARTSRFRPPLNISPADREKLQYNTLMRKTYKALPQVRAEAKQWAEAIIFKLTGKVVDADTIFLNRFNQAQSAGTATGWEHQQEEPTQSQALPDALLSNFTEHDRLPGVLDQTAGLYRVGAGYSSKGGYGRYNQFPLTPSALLKEATQTDFQARINLKQAAFWKDHGDDYRTTLKGEFIFQARQQLKAYERTSPEERAKIPAEQRFTREDYRLVMGAAANVPLDENQALTVKQLQKTAPAKGVVHVHAFDINGYPSNDILRFTAPDDGTHPQLRDRRDGVQVLYIPGHQPVFLRFESLSAMDQWVTAQGRDANQRKALASHFSIRDRQDNGVGFWSDFKSFFTGDTQSDKGVVTAIKYLSNGYWDSIEGAVIDSANVAIHGDVFSVMKQATRKRMTSDADMLIKSNSEVARDTWLNDLTAAAGLLAKFAVVAEPVVVAAAAVSAMAETGLGLEKATTGDTQAQRTQGAANALDGALNTLFSVAGGNRTEVIEETWGPTAYVLPRANGYDVVDNGHVYRYLDAKPNVLTDMESPEHAQPLEGFEAICPAPSTGARVRRGAGSEYFAKLITDLEGAPARLQALEHVQLFASKAGMFNKAKTVVYARRLHMMIETETGPQLVPAANAKPITYRKQISAKIVSAPGFGFHSSAHTADFANSTRVVKLNKISNLSEDQRQVRGVVVASGTDQYLVVEADIGEFYYAGLGNAPMGDITLKKCGPFQLSLVHGYREFLGEHHPLGANVSPPSAFKPIRQPVEKPAPRRQRVPKVKPGKTVQVAMGESVTLSKSNEVLSTRSLTDCSALAVLTDWNGSTYQTRTLMHLTGSNLELGLRGGNTQTLLDKLQASLSKGGKVMLVAGVNSDSIQGFATTIGQTFEGKQPLRELLKERPGVSVTLASSLGVTINADGTFEMIDDTGKGVLTADMKRQVFDRVD